MILPHLAVNGLPTSMISRLIPRYAEPHRKYHTWSHIIACFEAAEFLIAPLSLEIALALLFHDAIYDPERSDNEYQSAALLMNEGAIEAVGIKTLERARAMVLATKHDAAPESEDACIVVDADLSILGAPAAVFDTYEDAIREEYAFVDDAAFAAGRMKIMQSFLDRERIFQTRIGHAMWEEAARANLRRSVKRWMIARISAAEKRAEVAETRVLELERRFPVAKCPKCGSFGRRDHSHMYGHVTGSHIQYKSCDGLEK